MRLADRHLIDKCLNSDSAAFGMLVDRYKESVYALAYSRLRNFHDAEDITQEAFTRAYQKLRTLRRWDEFHAWIYAITSNLCKDWIRARARRPDREFAEDHSVRSLSRYSVESRNEDPMLEVLHEALDSLPQSYQQALTLHYLGGMDGTEIAEFLGKSPSAIWQMLSRARALLKKEILDMMSETYEQNRLRAGFTFRIVEMVKRIRIDPVPPRVWPWGFSIATGLIMGVFYIGMNANLSNTEPYTSISSFSGESKVLDIGEFPVDVTRISDMTTVSDWQVGGEGGELKAPNGQNALLMAPQAGDKWTKRADMPTTRNSLGVGVVNDKIYAIGGMSMLEEGGVVKFRNVKTVEEYDPATDTWTKKADMPNARNAFGIGVVKDKIYVIGGYQGQDIVTTVEEYDPNTDKWARKTDMPTKRVSFGTCVANGKIYAIGGGTWEAPFLNFSTVEEYDPATDTWTKRADMPTPRLDLSASAANGKIYAIGGLTHHVDLGNTVVEEYDPAIDEWTRKADMPTVMGVVRRCFGSVAVNGGIYVVGGALSLKPWSRVPTVDEYDPLTDKWAGKADMPTARDYPGIGAVNGKIYAIGGSTEDGPASIVEEYDPGTTSKSINPEGKLPTTWGAVRTASSR